MERLQELQALLPRNWSELKLKDFMKLTDTFKSVEDGITNPFTGANNTFLAISALTGATIEELEGYNMLQLAPILRQVDFFSTPPVPKEESPIKLKSIEEIKYNDFVTYQVLSSEPFKNLHLIIKAFAKTELTDEQVLNLGTEDVINAFFLFANQAKLYVDSTIPSLRKKLRKQITKELMDKLLFKKNSKKKKQN